LLDLHIPKDDVKETIAAIRAKNPAAKIVIQSGERASADDSGPNAQNLGVEGWTTKANPITELLGIIKPFLP